MRTDPYRVLYIDDEESFLDLVKIFLERKEGFLVDVTTLPSVVLESLHGQRYDVIISDYEMPGMNGIELLKAVREADQTFPFILFTGRGREEVVIDALNYGANFYIQKGGEPKSQFAELAHKVRQAVLLKQHAADLQQSHHELEAAYNVIARTGEDLRANLEKLTIQEQALRESEEKFRTFFESAGDAIIILDDGLIYDCNHQAEVLFRLSKTRLIGQSPADFAPKLQPDGRSSRDLAVEKLQVSSEGRPLIFEFVHRYPDGRDFFAEITLQQIRMHGRGFQQAIVRDISERKRNELELLRKNEELATAYEEILSAEEDSRKNQDLLIKKDQDLQKTKNQLDDIISFLPDATFVINQEGVVIAWNRALETLTGVQAEQILGQGGYAYTLPFYHEPRPALIDLALSWDRTVADWYPFIGRRGEYLTAETYIPHFHNGNGAYLWFTACPFYDHAGNVIGAIECIRDITERKKAETALQQSEERYRSVVNDQVEMIARFSAEGTITFANEAYHSYFLSQKSRDEVTGREIWGIMQVEMCDPIRSSLRTLTPEKPIREMEITFPGPDGESHWQVWSVRGIFNPQDGQLTEYQVVGRDITDQKRAEEAFKRSERRFNLFMDHLPAAVYIKDKDGKLIFSNRYVNNLFGWKDPAGKSTFELLPKDIAQEMVEDDRKAFMAGVVSKLERLADSKGDEHVFSTTKFALPDTVGSSLIGGISIDITGLMHAEYALRVSEEKFSKTFQFSPDLFLLSSIPDGRIVDVNDSIYQITGYRREEVVGNTIKDLNLWVDDRVHEQYVSQVHREGAVRNLEAAFRKKDEGIINCLISGTTIQLESGPCFISVVRDITERKRVLETLREANKKLNLLSSITRHDMNNQLTALSGYLTITREMVKDHEIGDCLDKSLHIIDILERQIRFTGDYQDLGMHAPAWQNINTLIHKAMAALPLHSIRVDIEESDLEVFADPLLEKVFYNLIDNSLRYGGAKMYSIRTFFHETENGLVITVMDDGEGISHGMKQHLFEKGVGKNTGLGLFLSREILSLTGITITETGEPGTGARFEILVPEGKWRMGLQEQQ